jgi:YhcH/YjgK/YiaL family protein
MEDDMLVESLQDWKHYDFGPAWRETMAWAAAHADAEPGEWDVAGCHIRIWDNQTRLWGQGRYECHRRMADVQLVLQGEEDVYNLPLHRMTAPDAFDEERDLGFFNDTARLSPIRLVPGLFCLLLPWDAHMPSMAVADAPVTVRKMVIKIPADQLTL